MGQRAGMSLERETLELRAGARYGSFVLDAQGVAP
jgi:hypothetical protein